MWDMRRVGFGLRCHKRQGNKIHRASAGLIQISHLIFMQAGRDQRSQHKASLASVALSGSMTSGKEIWSKPVPGTIVSGMGLLS